MTDNLVSAATFKALTPVAVADADLDAVIGRAEAELTAELGAPYTDGLELTEIRNGGGSSVFVRRQIGALVSVTEADTWIDADATEYELTAGAGFVLWAGQGRLERIGDRDTWRDKVTIVYTPADDTAAWQRAIIDLARLDLARSAFRSESVAGEYSYQAPPSWERERAAIKRRITFPKV